MTTRRVTARRLRRWLMIIAGSLVVVGLVGDLAAKRYAEDVIETSVRREMDGVGAVDASISSFPFLGRLLVAGVVSHVELVLRDVVGRGIPVEEVRFAIDDLRFARQDLVDGDRVEVTGSGPVSVRLLITRANVESLLGPLTAVAFALTDGTKLTVDDGRVQLGAGIAFPLPSPDLIPCTASAQIENSQIVIDCVADAMPQVVIDAIGAASLRNS